MAPVLHPDPIDYPSSDGEPVAETFTHLYALLVTLEVLRQYVEGQRATVLANQFLYYSQGMPRLPTNKWAWRNTGCSTPVANGWTINCKAIA